MNRLAFFRIIVVDMDIKDNRIESTFIKKSERHHSRYIVFFVLLLYCCIALFLYCYKVYIYIYNRSDGAISFLMLLIQTK